MSGWPANRSYRQPYALRDCHSKPLEQTACQYTTQLGMAQCRSNCGLGFQIIQDGQNYARSDAKGTARRAEDDSDPRAVALAGGPPIPASSNARSALSIAALMYVFSPYPTSNRYTATMPVFIGFHALFQAATETLCSAFKLSYDSRQMGGCCPVRFPAELNRRHKFALSLTLLVVGSTLTFSKEIPVAVGAALLGLAFTWAIGSKRNIFCFQH